VNSGCDLSYSVVPAAISFANVLTNRRDEGGRHAIHHIYSLQHIHTIKIDTILHTTHYYTPSRLEQYTTYFRRSITRI
jgi:hypothetical protein